MKSLHATIALCCLLAAAHGQTKEKEAESAATKARLEKKIAAMRQAMRDGKIREFNVYVKVRLTNGNRLRGVVKHGRFVEMPDGIDFVSAASSDARSAGMRVWYTAGTTSFVFLRYEDIARYEIGSRLTDQQVKAIEMKLEKELAETRENYRRLRETKKGGSPEKVAGAEKAGSANPGVPALTAEQTKLLADFPPEGGWGEEKLQELKRRRITVGVFPNEKELLFEKVYPEWKVAHAAQQKIAAAAKTGKDATPAGTAKEAGPKANVEKTAEPQPPVGAGPPKN